MGAMVLRGIVVLAGYLLTLGLSGTLVRRVVGGPSALGNQRVAGAPAMPRAYDIGAIIGKCENILTITFILANALTGLALIFTAKSIVRGDDIKKDARYFLGGTLVNFTFSVLMGFLVRLAVEGIG